MPMLDWSKCDDDQWCPFMDVQLDHPNAAGVGVYVIWCCGKDRGVPVTLYVGQGEIANRLRAHREEGEILSYLPFGLCVTWALVEQHDLDGVERFLFNNLRPKLGQRAPNVNPLPVNLPWPSPPCC